MKKLVFLFLLVSAGLMAQEETTEAVYPAGGTGEFGIGLGYTGSYATDDGFTSAEGYDTGDGGSLGFQYEYFLSSSWGIKARLNVELKSVEVEAFGDQLDLLYITVPVMASWHFGMKKRWYLHFGPYVGILTYAQLRDAETDLKDQFNSVEFGSDIGVGVRIPALKGKWFFIELDFQNGFSTPFKDNTVSDEKLGRSTIGFGLIF